MKTSALKAVSIGTLICLSCVGHAQDDEATLLYPAVQCLAAKKFLPPSKRAYRTFGYVLDEKSYPREKMLYVVEYTEHAPQDGLVFTIFVTDHPGHRDLNIQNNARFTASKHGNGGVSFADPPLGGSWTQEHLISAIKQIEKKPKIALPMKIRAETDPSVRCAAYTAPE